MDEHERPLFQNLTNLLVLLEREVVNVAIRARLQPFQQLRLNGGVQLSCNNCPLFSPSLPLLRTTHQNVALRSNRLHQHRTSPVSQAFYLPVRRKDATLLGVALFSPGPTCAPCRQSNELWRGLKLQAAHADQILRDLGKPLFVFVHQELGPVLQVRVKLLERLHSMGQGQRTTLEARTGNGLDSSPHTYRAPSTLWPVVFIHGTERKLAMPSTCKGGSHIVKLGPCRQPLMQLCAMILLVIWTISYPNVGAIVRSHLGIVSFQTDFLPHVLWSVRTLDRFHEQIAAPCKQGRAKVLRIQ
jgi:hypothetical protein